eukprot:scaffold14608_cov102-Cylindrotheca_fusiformis.AAC.4
MLALAFSDIQRLGIGRVSDVCRVATESSLATAESVIHQNMGDYSIFCMRYQFIRSKHIVYGGQSHFLKLNTFLTKTRNCSVPVPPLLSVLRGSPVSHVASLLAKKASDQANH